MGSQEKRCSSSAFAGAPSLQQQKPATNQHRAPCMEVSSELLASDPPFTVAVKARKQKPDAVCCWVCVCDFDFTCEYLDDFSTS